MSQSRVIARCADVLHHQIRPDPDGEESFDNVSIILNMPGESDWEPLSIENIFEPSTLHYIQKGKLLFTHLEIDSLSGSRKYGLSPSSLPPSDTQNEQDTVVLFPCASDCALVCRFWPPCLRFLTPGIMVGFWRFSFVLPGPLCCGSGPCGEDRVPVPCLYWRGGSRERRDHVHLRALAGSAGQGHGGEHPHR